MSEKSIVYWATPYELSAIQNSTKNMVTNNLVKTRLILDRILENFIKPGEKVALKVHVGEAYNTHYLRHDYVHQVVEAVKFLGANPILVETQGLGMEIHLVNVPNNCEICLGHRKTSEDHLKIANLHGYSESVIGAPLEFIDGDKGINAKLVKIDGIHYNEVPVGSGLFDYDKLIVISHFKGHPQAGFGGALKNLGIGCVTKKHKYLSHFEGYPSVSIRRCDLSKCDQECIKACPVDAIKIENEKAVIDHSICEGCLGCAESCPVRKAIKIGMFRNIKDFNEIFIDNATAVISSFGPENIRYINFAFDIPLMCDCVVNANMPVVPDLGIFGSSDPLAIDKACVDMETNAPGLPVLNAKGEWTEIIAPGIEKFKAMNPIVDTTWQINAAVKNGIGNLDYELIKI